MIVLLTISIILNVFFIFSSVLFIFSPITDKEEKEHYEHSHNWKGM